MKTKKAFFDLLMILSLSFFVVSCGKEAMSVSNVKFIKSSNYTQVAQATGAIVDLGAIDGGVYKMNVSLSNVSISLFDLPDGTPVASSQLMIDLITESAGTINDGTYMYSDYTNVSPFTFINGSVNIPNMDSGKFDAFNLNGGTVSVTRNGSNYTINLDGTLSDGNSVHGTFNGILSYVDPNQNQQIVTSTNNNYGKNH